MNWLENQMATMTAASGAIEFALNWLIQSTILIAAGLALANFARRKGSAVQSLVYRTTLAAVLICPLVTWGMSRFGVTGWSITMPTSYTVANVDGASNDLPTPQAETGTTPAIASKEGLFTEKSIVPWPEVPRISDDLGESVVVAPIDNHSPHRTLNSRDNDVHVSSTSMVPTVIGSPEATEPSVTWFGWIAPFSLAVWLIASGYFLAKLMTSWWRMNRLVQRAHAADESTREFCRKLALELNVKTPGVFRSPFIPSPCLAGLGIVRKTSILLPDNELDLPLRDVLVHELAHLRRHDCRWNLLRQIATAVYFFQPLLWVLSRRIEITAEEVCDDFVVQLGGDRRDYASRLVDIAELSTEFSAAAVGAAGVGIVSLRSMLARRVERIMDTSRALSTGAGNRLLVAVLLFAVIGTAIVGLVGLQSSTHADEATTASEGDPEVAKGNGTSVANGTKANGSPQRTQAENVTLSYSGKVVDTAGKPVSGADVYLVYHIPDPVGPLTPNWKPAGQTDSNGDFEFAYSPKQVGPEVRYSSISATKEGFGFAVSAATQFEIGDTQPEKDQASRTLKLVQDHPIRVRVLDINGQPVTGAKMTLLRVFTNTKNDLSDWNEVAQKPNADFYRIRDTVPMVMNGPQTRSLVKQAVTDEKGNLEVRGVGKGRMARFLLEGPGIESEKLFVRTESGKKFELLRQSGAKYLGTQTYYPSEFQHVSGPSVPITGVIRDAETKKPLAGVAIKSQRRHGQLMSGWGEDFVRTFTDKSGRYRLEGMPVGKDNRVAVIVPDAIDPQTGKLKANQIAYLSTSTKAPTNASQSTATLDIEMVRGVWAKGRVTDRRTRKGLPGRLKYFMSKSNANKVAGHVDERDRLRSDAEGNFRIPVAPGKGFLAFLARDHEKYPRATKITLADGNTRNAPRTISAKSETLIPTNYHAVVEFDAVDDTKDVELSLQIGTGLTRLGTVVDANGKPVVGFHYRGKKPTFSRWTSSLLSSRFALDSYEHDETRHVYFTHLKRNLAGHAAVTGDPKEPLVVSLVTGGSAKGRIVNEDGDPIANRSFVSWRPSMASRKETKSSVNVAPLPYSPSNAKNYGWYTDNEGRFELNCLLPNTEYRLMVLPEGIDDFIRPVDVVIKVASGESKDLGDLALANYREFNDAAMKSLAKTSVATETDAESVDNTTDPLTVRSPEKKSHRIDAAIVLPNGKPATDAHVALTGYDYENQRPVVFASGVTDKNGNCQLTYVNLERNSSIPDVKTLLARKDGFAVGWKVIGGSDAQTSAEKTMTVSLKTQGLIKGRLVDIEGQPAAGEHLQVDAVMNPMANRQSANSRAGFWTQERNQPKAWLQPIVTDAEGRFTVTGIPEKHGVYVRLVDSKDFAPQSISLNTGQPEQRGEHDGTYRSLVKNVGPGEEAVLTLAPAKVITGTITYEDTKQPVANARVSIWASQQKFGSMSSVEGTTDAEGKYRILPKPGIRFGVSAFPPAGTAYMGRKAEHLDWENSDSTRTVDIQLPKVTLVKGRVVEKGTGKPVADATITFVGSSKYAPDNVVTGWQSQQKSDADGRFTYAAPRRGTLVVRKRSSNYVLQTMASRKMRTGKPGGSRFYANAFHIIDVPEGQETIDAIIEVQPGKTVRGVMVDEEGTPIEQAAIITRLKVWDLAGGWRGDSSLNLGSKFELTGLAPNESYKVHFLDARRRLGATIDLKATDQEVKVVLRPCGEATARFIVKDAEKRSNLINKSAPTLTFVLTPGSTRFDIEAMRAGKLAADSDFNANIDRFNYGYKNGPKFDKDLRFTLPALIPGATYRLQTTYDQSWGFKEFTVKSGETLDLGEFTPKFDE